MSHRASESLRLLIFDGEKPDFISVEVQGSIIHLCNMLRFLVISLERSAEKGCFASINDVRKLVGSPPVRELFGVAVCQYLVEIQEGAECHLCEQG
jgi:hypothetical protein